MRALFRLLETRRHRRAVPPENHVRGHPLVLLHRETSVRKPGRRSENRADREMERGCAGLNLSLTLSFKIAFIVDL